MAPRARRRKVGLTRMDAATDALCQLGFPKALIRDTVKSLLKVYGGDSGWVFIEEDSYKVVIEKILENEEKSLPERDEAQEADSVPVSGPLTELGMETSDPYTAAETDTDPPLLEGGASGKKNFEEIQSLPPAVDLPRPKKNPCYGWISNDDDMDFVVLKTNDSLRRLPIERATESNGGRRRKSRWDVKPEDL